MEGVVLYIALVRVFVTYPKQYIMCIRLLNYGLLIIFIDVFIIMTIIGITGVYMLIIVLIRYIVGTNENHTHYLLYTNKTWLRE